MEGRRPGLLGRFGPPGRLARDRRAGGPGEERPPVASAPPDAATAPRDDSQAEGTQVEATTGERTAPAEPIGAEGDGAGEPVRRPVSEERPAQASPAGADPAPLGLGALAVTTLLFSLFSSGLLSDAGVPVVLGVALAYGGVAQLLAGMWEFRSGNTFGATAFTSYGAFWLSLFVLEAFFADQVPTADLPVYLGWTLIAWALFTTYMYIASVRLTGAVNVVFLLLAATLYLVGTGEVVGADIVTRVGGFVGLITAVAAGYASFATLGDRAFRQTVLPAREPGRGMT